MLVNDEDAKKRLNSPSNLINRLRSIDKSRSSAMSLFIPSGNNKKQEVIEIKKFNNPFEKKEPLVAVPTPTNVEETKLEDILDNHDSQIRLGLAHDNALELLNSSVAMLASKLDDVKADKLPSVIAAASKTVESIRKERTESKKNNKDREVHYHFYTPEQKTVSDYEIIDVTQ